MNCLTFQLSEKEKKKRFLLSLFLQKHGTEFFRFWRKKIRSSYLELSVVVFESLLLLFVFRSWSPGKQKQKTKISLSSVATRDFWSESLSQTLLTFE